MPSGKLCNAMANTISQTRRNCIQSGPWRPDWTCSCGMALSASSRNSAPSTRPVATRAAPAGLLPRMSLPAATPGRMSEKHDAAIITPAPKPSMMSSQRDEIRRTNSAGSAPSAVASAADRGAGQRLPHRGVEAGAALRHRHPGQRGQQRHRQHATAAPRHPGAARVGQQCLQGVDGAIHAFTLERDEAGFPHDPGTKQASQSGISSVTPSRPAPNRASTASS